MVPLDKSLTRRIAARLLALINTIPGRHWSMKELLVKRPGKFRYSRVWLSGDEVAGVVLASRKGPRVHIHQIVIDAPYQRQGWGRSAYYDIARQTQADGLTHISAHCIMNEREALAFHTALGFTLDSRYYDPDDGLEYGRMSVSIETLLEKVRTL